MMRKSVLLNMGVMLTPLGLVVALEALNHEHSLMWFVLGIYGIVMSLIGLALIYVLFRDSKKDDSKKAIQQAARDKLLIDAVSELKKLNAKGGGNNDRKDNSDGTE